MLFLHSTLVLDNGLLPERCCAGLCKHPSVLTDSGLRVLLLLSFGLLLFLLLTLLLCFLLLLCSLLLLSSLLQEHLCSRTGSLHLLLLLFLLFFFGLLRLLPSKQVLFGLSSLLQGPEELNKLETIFCEHSLILYGDSNQLWATLNFVHGCELAQRVERNLEVVEIIFKPFSDKHLLLLLRKATRAAQGDEI